MLCWFSQYNFVPKIRADKLHPKSLGKLVMRLAKSYNIPATDTPNLVLIRSTNALRHLLYRRYHEKSLADETWEDFVSDAMQNSPGCAAQFVRQLCFAHQDFDEAARWARRFQLDTSKLPDVLYKFMLSQTPEQSDFTFKSASPYT